MFLKEDNILVVRSKESIAAAMFRLMSCDSYQLLTITQICQEADISRQTFYHHFKEKEEILEYYLYSRFFTYTEKHPDTGDMTRNVHHLFENFPVSKHKLQLLKHQNIFNILRKR